ncbi:MULTISPECIES: DUF4153 domain-containing protein [Streptomyces]|uniref:DUF4153 domain-containing protein n=1 Tax=Streptomyces TaxID=1883 RepID=UPI0006AFC888|nr:MULTISPECIES: DUF4173 domain-containing protein [unclassified Streptomyces]KOU96220.1 hypothetical protein ADK93_03750 [Streptomyces sp. XY58]KOV11790.1 hypothetical protein ADK89_03135 [Streptomyces sp. XY37]KOV54981.1 hypothetical protein ADK99_04270 [Streptomyces sp. MMG1064]
MSENTGGAHEARPEAAANAEAVTGDSPKDPAAASAPAQAAAPAPAPAPAAAGGPSSDAARPQPGAPADAAAWTAWQQQQHQQRQQQQRPWGAPGAHSPVKPSWATVVRPAEAAPVRTATLVAVLASGLAAALLLADGMGSGLLLAVAPAVVAAYVAARAAGRTARPWTLAWVIGCLALLAVPALRDSAWPVTLAILAAVLLGALALHGSRTWPGVFLSPLGFADSTVSGIAWMLKGLRSRGGIGKDRWLPVAKAAAVAVALLVLFGALFASADAAFADLLGGLIPDVSVEDGPIRFMLFVLGAVIAVAAARTAAAPLRWDRIEVAPGKPRSRVEWALPLVVLNLLFAGFNAVQLAVLFGGYDKVLDSTGLTYAEYARQGFWQLLWATLLTLAVIALALRWAPRSGAGDRRLVRIVLGSLCALTLVVVAAALRRMDLYVDAYGLTRLRVSVAAMELWLGLVIVLIMAAGVFGARWLPRAVAGSAAAAVLAFGLLSPDGMIAERNVARFEKDRKIDLAYFQSLSADAVPALDRLPEPRRSCALRGINDDMARAGDVPWYAMSMGEYRAREILRERPVTASYEVCSRLGTFGSRAEY